MINKCITINRVSYGFNLKVGGAGGGGNLQSRTFSDAIFAS